MWGHEGLDGIERATTNGFCGVRMLNHTSRRRAAGRSERLLNRRMLAHQEPRRAAACWLEAWIGHWYEHRRGVRHLLTMTSGCRLRSDTCSKTTPAAFPRPSLRTTSEPVIGSLAYSGVFRSPPEIGEVVK